MPPNSWATARRHTPRRPSRWRGWRTLPSPTSAPAAGTRWRSQPAAVSVLLCEARSGYDMLSRIVTVRSKTWQLLLCSPCCMHVARPMIVAVNLRNVCPAAEVYVWGRGE